jgi:uncharacterized membrane protein
VYQGIRLRIAVAVKSYPFKDRAVSALLLCISLLVVSMKWLFEPAKIVALCAFTVSRLFDIKGRWFTFFMGIGVGDMLLYVWR